jgi:hypothetical protein
VSVELDFALHDCRRIFTPWSLPWQGPDRQTLRDTFDLFVTTDGCYTATAAAETLGGPTLKTTTGSSVRNLLYAFEGCFDTM